MKGTFRKPRKTEQDEGREEHLYVLADRVSDILDGEPLYDVASVCALLSACAIMQYYSNPETRMKAVQVMNKFMTQVMEYENRSDATWETDCEQLSPDHHE